MEDSDIITQAKMGNKGAYREFLRKYAPLALAVAFARTDNREAARVAAADAFVAASRELVDLPDAAPIPPWIANAVRAAVARRMGARTRVTLTPEAAKEKVKTAVEEAGGRGAVEPEKKNELASVAFRALSNEAREILCLRHLYSIDYVSIASAMATGAGDADQNIARARELLADIMEPLFV